VKGLFRPHYRTWSEQTKIEAQEAPEHLKNVIRIIAETAFGSTKNWRRCGKE
jgi:hypothetical protein